MKYEFKTEPDAYQLDALKRALKMRKFGVFFQQRVGKTKVGIDFAGALHVGLGYTRVLVSTTLSGISVWEGQIAEHLGVDFAFSTLAKIPSKRKAMLREKTSGGLHFLCVSHDSLYNNKALLMKWKPQVIILDEVHEFKSTGSKRSRAAYSLTRDCRYVLGLTGTPIPKRPFDIFGVFKVINPDVFGIKVTTFRNHFCIMGGYMGHEVIGYKNRDEMSRLIADNSIRVLRKDVMKEPKVEYITVPVELEASARQQYRELRRNAVIELESMATVTAAEAGVRAMRLQQFCGGFLKDDDGIVNQVSTAKLDATIELVKDLREQDEPVVIFAQFLPELQALSEALHKEKIDNVVIQGSTPPGIRAIAREGFQKGNYNVILLQIHVGSMAISLDRACINIYYSLNHRLTDFQQSRDRIMGRGQKRDVTNYMMAVKHSADEKVIKVLRNDEDLSSAIGDKWRWMFDDD